MEIAIVLGIYFIEIINYSLAFRIIYKEQIQRRWGYCAGGAILLLYMALVGWEPARDYYPRVLAMTVLGVSGKTKDSILKSLIAWILLVLIDEIPSAAFSRLESVWQNVPYIHSYMNLLTSIWGLMVLVVIFLFVKKKRETPFWNMNRVRLVVIVNGVALSLTVAELNFAKKKFSGTGFALYVDMISTIAYVSLALLCGLILYFRDQDEHKAALLEMEKKYYQMLLQKEEDTRRFRHDLANHLLCLHNLAGKDDMDGVKKYLAQMSAQAEQISRRTYTTGNELVDMILNDKFSGAGDRIKVQITGKFVSEPDMAEMDLCIIFSNIFQNAAEELSRQEQGWFQMQISPGKQFTEIAVKNSVSERIELTRSGFPKTRKGDTRNHGLGLQNVKDTVEKNHGSFQITSEENGFEVKIQLINLPITNLNDR